jgi:hypothetical protein
MDLLMVHLLLETFDQNVSNAVGQSTIFARFGHVWFLAIPKIVGCFEGLQIFRLFSIQGHILTILNNIPDGLHQCYEQ